MAKKPAIFIYFVIMWFSFTLKKIGGFRKISVGCRGTKKSSVPRTILFYSSRNLYIYIFCFILLGLEVALIAQNPPFLYYL